MAKPDKLQQRWERKQEQPKESKYGSLGKRAYKEMLRQQERAEQERKAQAAEQARQRLEWQMYRARLLAAMNECANRNGEIAPALFNQRLVIAETHRLPPDPDVLAEFFDWRPPPPPAPPPVSIADTLEWDA